MSVVCRSMGRWHLRSFEEGCDPDDPEFTHGLRPKAATNCTNYDRSIRYAIADLNATLTELNWFMP